MKLPLIEMTIDEANESFVSAIALVESPAIESNWLAFTNEAIEKFALNEDKQIITGAAMIPDKPLYRNSPDGGFYAVFSKDTIQQIQQVFFKKGLIQSLNVDHNSDQPCKDSYIFQSYITDNSMGVSAPKALGIIPDGSWIISVKIDNPDLWKSIKNNEVRGFSVEGLFQLLPTNLTVSDISTIDDNELSKAIKEFNAAIERLNNKR